MWFALAAIAASSDHASIGRPPIRCSGFGNTDFRRVPCPAARMIAAISIVFIYAFSFDNAKHLQKIGFGRGSGFRRLS